MVIASLVLAGAAGEAAIRRIGRSAGIPLAASLVGLVASATHLGNPGNALYVFMGVGHSPLSNEVFCAIAFLGVASVCWLYSFSEHPGALRRRLGALLTIVSGAVFITAIALAYHVNTIPSWDTPLVPILLWANAVVGGPLLALLSLRIARLEFACGVFGRGLVAISSVALVVNMALCIVQAAGLSSIENSYATAAALVPEYGAMVAAFAVLAGAGCALCAYPLAIRHNLSIAHCAAACAFVLAGVFVLRFAFYMTHMTVGL